MGRDGDPRTRTITEVLGIAIHLQSFLKALPPSIPYMKIMLLS